MAGKNKGERTEPETEMIPTPELARKVCSVIRMGLDFRTACLAHAVDSETIEIWARNIKSEKNSPWPEFKRQLEFAGAQCIAILTKRILTEGGESGARFILQNMLAKQKAPVSDPCDDDPYAWLKGKKK